MINAAVLGVIIASASVGATTAAAVRAVWGTHSTPLLGIRIKGRNAPGLKQDRPVLK